ncbi:probable cytochrome P450 49a1 [Penaeus indicus]|uniref:probable cytochrome P450 49a1 n=1 Tax=Penaeus indicus TaxID=29960 RepID=UPI00300CF409
MSEVRSKVMSEVRSKSRSEIMSEIISEVRSKLNDMKGETFDPTRVYLFWQALEQEFGPIFRKDMPGHPNMVFITNPEDVCAMFEATRLDPVRPGLTSLKKIREEQGEEWWRVRRRVQKPITDPALVSRYLPAMDDVAKAFFLDSLYETENVKLWQYFPTTSITRLKEAHGVFSEVALRAIEDTERALASCRREREEPRRLSLLETLLATPGLSRGDVLTFLVDLLATGIDTTSHSVSHMLYLLAKNPEVQGRVIHEIDAEVGQPEHLSPEHIARLSYTRAVFRETLRIMPVGIGITRRLNRDTVLGGYLVPKGWQVVVPSMLVNHKDSIFPRASEFLPERFVRGSPLAPKHSYAFLPFSVGTRMCIGRRIAQQEIMCLFVRVLGEFTVDYKHEDIHLVNKLNYRPSHPLRFTFNDRA